jgi:cell division initiation protein
MKLTPLEIRHQQFRLRFRGYDPMVVDAFLELVAGAIEDLFKEKAKLQEALAQKDQEIQRVQQEQDDWKKILVAAQQAAEDVVGRGKKRARAMVAAAERKAQRMLIEAGEQRQGITDDVQQLKRQRGKLLLQIRHVLAQHLTLLSTQEVESGEKQFDDAPKPIAEVTAAPQNSDGSAHAVVVMINPVEDDEDLSTFTSP